MRFQPNTLKQTILVSVFFLLLVTTYISFSNIITFIFQHDSNQFPFVGSLSLILNYFVYLLGLTYAASLKNFKKQFEIAAIAYTLNYALYIFNFGEVFTLVVSIIGAIIGGYGASVLWVSQGGYMVKLFKKYSISGQAQGQYMGIQSGIIYGQVILGGAVTTFVLGLFGNQVYFIALTAIGLISYLFCHFLVDSLEEPQQNTSLQEDNQRQEGFLQQLLQVLKFYPKMKFFLPAMILDGIILAFTTTNFSNLVAQPLQTNFNVGLLHISNGVGAIIGGFLSGYLSSKMSVLLQGVILFAVTLFTLIATLPNNLYEFATINYAILTTFLWGISLFFLEGWLFVSCVRIFQGHIESFAVVKQMHTLSFIAFQIYSLLLGQIINFIATLAALLFLTFLCLLLSIYMYRKQTGKTLELVEAQQKIEETSPVQIN